MRNDSEALNHGLRRLYGFDVLLLVLSLLVVLAGCEWREITTEGNAEDSSTTLRQEGQPTTSGVVAVKVATAPTVDGQETDAAWGQTQAYVIPVHGYSGERVTMKAVYTDADIFFLISWSDYSHSVRQAGSWARVHVGAQFGKAPTEAGDKWERFGVEDALSLIWNISAADFAREDFPTKAHLPGVKTSAGTMDRWFWAAGSTDPVHRLLDQFIDQSGVHDDSGTSFLIPNVAAQDVPGTSINENDYPAYMPRADLTQRKIPKLFIVEGEKPVLLYYRSEVEPFNLTTIDREATLPGYIFEDNPSGSVIDVQVGSTHAATAETWTLEIQRRLITATPEQDIQFDDRSKVYPFVIGVFDNTDIDGSFSQVQQLRFAR
jgi:hypothetical protein